MSYCSNNIITLYGQIISKATITMKGDLIDDVRLQKFSELKSSNHLWYALVQTNYAENHKQWYTE